MKRPFTLALLGVLLVPVLAFRFGGWAVITVEDLPDQLVAGRPVQLAFVVRQHGMSPIEGLKPVVTIGSGDVETTAAATPAGERGRYVATITAPKTGEWTPRIHSGFLDSENTLLPLHAVAAGAPPRTIADADRGHELFFAKGCVTCHVRGTEGNTVFRVGPDLTGKRYVADYVAKFLADPESSPLSRASGSPNRMPKLNLKEREIASLVAFLNADVGALGRR